MTTDLLLMSNKYGIFFFEFCDLQKVTFSENISFIKKCKKNLEILKLLQKFAYRIHESHENILVYNFRSVIKDLIKLFKFNNTGSSADNYKHFRSGLWCNVCLNLGPGNKYVFVSSFTKSI